MARARNIKPSIFRNEILGTIDPLITILFESLWCLADRDGKLEDRPLRIKADTFPYRENIDINGYLTVLAQHNFIRRYSVSGVAVIQVTKFKEHQSPHKTERDSVLPDYDSQVVENKEENELTVIAPLKDYGLTEALPPESISLIPDSLIPDCLIKHPAKQTTARGSRLPENFDLDFQFAVDAGIQNTLEEANKFRDYWKSQPGQKGVKLDWQATWRNWCRNAKKTVLTKQIESFKERDARLGRERWEEMTGKTHPENLTRSIIDVIDLQIPEITHDQSY